GEVHDDRVATAELLADPAGVVVAARMQGRDGHVGGLLRSRATRTAAGRVRAHWFHRLGVVGAPVARRALAVAPTSLGITGLGITGLQITALRAAATCRYFIDVTDP